jgi:hypothetical protein
MIKGGSWHVTATALDGSRRMVWTLESSNRAGCVAASGEWVSPPAGGLLHFPVFLVAALALAGPDVPRPAPRPCSRMAVTRINRLAGRFRVAVAGRRS